MVFSVGQKVFCSQSFSETSGDPCVLFYNPYEKLTTMAGSFLH